MNVEDASWRKLRQLFRSWTGSLLARSSAPLATEVVRERSMELGVGVDEYLHLVDLADYEDERMTLIDMLKDYHGGNYRQLSYWSVSVITFSLLYVLNPIDIIPDSLPVIGELDDAMVISLGIAMVQREMHEYRIWRLARELSQD